MTPDSDLIELEFNGGPTFLEILDSPYELQVQAGVIVQGPKGDKGNPGSGQGSGDLNFSFVQSTPASTWVIAHNLGKNPSVTAFDSGGSEVRGSIVYNNLNQLTIIFNSGGFSGKAYLN